jgi:hypothetical protein
MMTSRKSRAQALVEFALVLMLILTTMVGGVLVIQALFWQQALQDVVARAGQWGAMTNSNTEIEAILNEAKQRFGIREKINGIEVFGENVQYTIEPRDENVRVLGTKLSITLTARLPLVGVGVSLEANLGARAVVLVERGKMRFVTPQVPPAQIAVGSYVLVETTGGESLNARRQPGLQGSPYFALFKGDRVIVVDGPVIKDGLRWWKIEKRFPNKTKLTGWSVDQADTIQTLQVVTQTF